MFIGNIMCEGSKVGWLAGFLDCFSAVFFRDATGLGLASFWLVAVGAHIKIEIRKKIYASYQVNSINKLNMHHDRN